MFLIFVIEVFVKKLKYLKIHINHLKSDLFMNIKKDILLSSTQNNIEIKKISLEHEKKLCFNYTNYYVFSIVGSTIQTCLGRQFR